jgi:hypothetical protein
MTITNTASNTSFHDIRLKLNEVIVKVNSDLQVANASTKYATKGYAASNSYVKLLLANTNAYIASISTGSGGGGGTAAIDYGSIASAIDVALNQDFGTL